MDFETQKELWKYVIGIIIFLPFFINGWKRGQRVTSELLEPDCVQEENRILDQIEREKQR